MSHHKPWWTEQGNGSECPDYISEHLTFRQRTQDPFFHAPWSPPTPSNWTRHNDHDEQRNFRLIGLHVCERPSLVRSYVVTGISTHHWNGPCPIDESSTLGAYVPVEDVDVSDAASPWYGLRGRIPTADSRCKPFLERIWRRNGNQAATAKAVRNRLRSWGKRMKRSWIADVTRGLPNLVRSSVVQVVLKRLSNRFIIVRWTPKPGHLPLREVSSIPMARSLLTLSRRGIPAIFNTFNVWCFC